MFSFQNVDISIFNFFNKQIANTAFDKFFPFITDVHKTWGFLYLVLPFIFLLAIYKLRKVAIVVIFFLCLAVALTDFSGGEIIKPFFGRLRPPFANVGAILRVPSTDGFSFISNHAANSFCIASFLAFLFPPLGYFLYPFAILIGFSRIYVGVHFPSDVLAGALYGSLVGYLFSRITLKFTKQMNKRKI